MLGDAPVSGAPIGNHKASERGGYSAETLELRREFRLYARDAKQLIKDMDEEEARRLKRIG